MNSNRIQFIKEWFILATNKRQFTLRVQEENFLKIKAIAEADRRSIAMEIEYILEQYIKDYEEKNGVIDDIEWLSILNN